MAKMIGEGVLKWLVDNNAVIVLDSVKKFEYIEKELYTPICIDEVRVKGFEDIKILGMKVLFIEGGVANLYDAYLKAINK